MKSRVIATVAVVAAIVGALLLIGADVAYPMHIGEPSYYHVGRINCLVAATACWLAAIVSAITSAYF